MQILSAIFFFIVAIGILVTIHEFGHFWVARRLGIKVLRFSIGFGRPLLSWRRNGGETEYVIAAIPLGGYVQMLDEREGPVATHEINRAFNRKPLLTRSAVIVAGPLFNFLFAILAYWLIFVVGVNAVKPVIGDIVPGTLAATGGFQSKDEILEVNGDKTESWNSVFLLLLDHSLRKDRLTVKVRDADDIIQQRVLDFDQLEHELNRENLLNLVGLQLYQPELAAVIDQVAAGEPADRAGLRSGDRIIRVNDVVIDGWSQWVAEIRAHPLQQLDVEIERDGRLMRLSIVPDKAEQGDFGRIGVGPYVPEGFASDYYTTVKYPPMLAMAQAINKTFAMSQLTLRMLGSMLLGEVSSRSISGPISIAQYAGYSADIGFIAFVSYLAIISISLGVLNLLPIPVLDGGHLLYFVIEFFKGSPLSDQAQLIGQKIGMLMLLGVMVLAFYNDFVRLFAG